MWNNKEWSQRRFSGRLVYSSLPVGAAFAPRRVFFRCLYGLIPASAPAVSGNSRLPSRLVPRPGDTRRPPRSRLDEKIAPFRQATERAARVARAFSVRITSLKGTNPGLFYSFALAAFSSPPPPVPLCSPARRGRAVERGRPETPSLHFSSAAESRGIPPRMEPKQMLLWLALKRPSWASEAQLD